MSDLGSEIHDLLDCVYADGTVDLTDFIEANGDCEHLGVLESTLFELMKDFGKLSSENNMLRRMVDGIVFHEHEPAEFEPIDGNDWFDIRESITGKETWK